MAAADDGEVDDADDDEADDADDDEADDEQAESPKYLTFKDADKDGYVSGVVAIPLKSFTDNDYEGILDIMSNALVGHGLLMDISHTMVGCNCHTEEVLIKVTGTCDWKEINDET